jgi:hypothetical protein
MKKMLLIILFVFIVASSAHAVPVLQVGAPAGPDDSGIYADYIANLTDPLEADTAITSGGTIYAAGAYTNDNVLLLGGEYLSILSDWNDFGFDNSFIGAGAILMATVADGSLGSGSLTVNGSSSLYSTSTYEDGFIVPNPPANHAPIPGQDYMFFDIGDFGMIDLIPNFDEESVGNTIGEIKTLDIATSGFDWIHFDVFALQTSIDKSNGRTTTSLTTSFTVDLEGNPGSKDVTWKQVPEPSTMILLGSSLIGLAIFRKKFKI